MSLYFVQLRIAPQNPKTPSCVLISKIMIIKDNIRLKKNKN